MSTKVELLRKYIREIIKQELKLQEASATGNIDGGEGPPKTPYAFQSKRKKDKEKENKIAKQSGYSKVNEGKINEIDYGNVFADMGDKLSDFKMKVVKPGMRIYNKGKAKFYMRDLYKSLEKCVDLCDMMNLMANESINEGKYHQYRNDDSLSPKQKIGYSMREVRDKLNELDKLVKMNVRLKNEIGVDSTSYWKNTHRAMNKISERLIKLANKVGQLY